LGGLDINPRCPGSCKVDPEGRKINRNEGLTGKLSWVTKAGAAGGGKLTKRKQSPDKELDSGEKEVIILISKTCSLKTK
jgi:hypothetical protein